MTKFINDEQDYSLAKMFASGLKPIPLMTVSEWADKFRYLSSMSSSEFGKYRTSRTPYIRKIQDSLGKTSPLKKIVVMKGAQLGLTELGNNWIGYLIHINPGPIILVMPTEAAARKNSRTRIKPMIDSTPQLKDKIKTAGAKEAGNTILEKEFPGGVLFMIGSNSPVGLSSTPSGNIFLDEVDRYPASAGDEGSPIALAEARSSTFSRKKIFIISTPEIEGQSLISKEFEEGDQQYYNVPCHGCDELFVLRFEYLTHEEGKPETTRMACPNCGFLHEERHKTLMLAEDGFGGKAKWIATAISSDPFMESFHLSALYSPAGWLSWEQVVRMYLKIKGDVNKEKVFVNTVLGETYKVKGESPDFENLYNRREQYPINIIPDDVYFLTMGVDIQGDRIELEIVGWCKGRSTYSIDYRVLIGDTQKAEVWEKLRQVISTNFECADGGLMPITLTAIDAGYNTKTVYDFAAGFGYNKVIPIMGRASVKDVMVSAPRAININRSGKKIEGAKVWYLGTSLLKSELYGFLKLKVTEVDGVDIFPDGYCHFPEYDRHYFKMLTAEDQVMLVNKKGYETFEWKKKFERNEALDIRCYARAAAYVLGIDRFKDQHFNKIRTIVKKEILEVSKKPKETKKRSSYWDK
jgi:phage terminase large subunit GpA-like protein